MSYHIDTDIDSNSIECLASSHKLTLKLEKKLFLMWILTWKLFCLTVTLMVLPH